MPSRSTPSEEITITGADMSGDGVFIEFSDGTTVLFHAQFLYDVRDQDANISIAEDEDDR